MKGTVPPLPHTLSWCAQEQRCLYIYRSVINISGLFHISELLYVEVVKIMRRPGTYRFLLQKFVSKHLCSLSRCGTLQTVLEGLREWFVCLFS